MSLTNEWKRRIDAWKNELINHFYVPGSNIQFEGSYTMEQLTVEKAAGLAYIPTPPGTKWGCKWEYGWFKSEFILPEDVKGKKIALAINLGAESAVYINGRNAGAKDNQHHFTVLCDSAVPGERYEIMVESYAGHGSRVTHGGPVPAGRLTVPEPPPAQCAVGISSFGIWQEDIYQLWLDVETLYQVRSNIEQASLRVAEIDKALKNFTLIVDLEASAEELLKSAVECRAYLKPLLDCTNGSTTSTMFVFGHSHIDVAWLWPLKETERKCTRTFATQLALMEQYPEYRYLQSQPYLYKMMKEHYPALYERIKEAVKKGQFIPEGGMWVEADTNITGGESLIRQFIYGKKFFMDEFGVNNVLCWLPDVFGYSGALPQIMKGCGMKYFSTQKIFWNYNGGEKFPYNTFIWEGIDGSQILAHFHNDYNSHTNPQAIIQRWNERAQKDGITTRLFPFGYGDGGGGATRDHLEYLRRLQNLEGVPKTKMCSPVEFFIDLEKQGIPEAKYVGELYFQAHRGTYTSQAKTKRGNRKSEISLREAEVWETAASVLKSFKYPAETMDDLWKLTLLNQFHDIIPGSSINKVYEDAEADYNKIISQTRLIADQAAESFTTASDAISVFNSLSWNRKVLVDLPADFKGARYENGTLLPVQEMDGHKLAEASAPSCGFTTIYSGEAFNVPNTLKISCNSMENEYIRIKLNDKGEIVSIFDKDSEKELVKGLCNCFKMYKDVPINYDAWDIDSIYSLSPVELPEMASIEVKAQGPLMDSLKVKRKLNNSIMSQEIIMRQGSRRVDFKTEIDWQESHKLLKVNFPVDIYTEEALHEIQFGYIKRPTHMSRQYDADRFEVSCHKWTALTEENRGFAVMNDCKYGVNAFDGSVNLTLLKSAMAPDMTADRGIQEFTYSFYVWNGCFADCDIIREAYDLNYPVTCVNGAAGEISLFRIDPPNIILETVKLSEDGSGDIILRLYEAKRMSTSCRLSTVINIDNVLCTDMLENALEAVDVKDGIVELQFKPFEIKTLRLKLKK